VRRISPTRGDRGLVDRRRAPRNSARHAAHARDRQPAESLFHRRGDQVRQRGVSGEGVSVARPGGDLCRRHSPAAWREISWIGRAVERRCHRSGHPRPRRHARDAARDRLGAHGPQRANGEGRASARGKGSAHRRLRVGNPAPGRTARDLDADDRRNGDGILARRIGPRGHFVHRRRRIVARRVARGDQRVRGAAIAGDFLCREQSDRAFNAGLRSIGGPGVRRQGGRLRHSRDHHRRNGSRPDCRRVHVGSRARAGRTRTDAHRIGRDADVRACAS